MKFSTFISILLVVGVIFFIFDMMLMEGNNKFSSGINDSDWQGKYDFAGQINSTINPLVEKFQVIQDPDQGFFSKIAAGLSAIPYAVIVFPQVIFGTLTMGGTITTGMLAALAIPAYIITVAIIGLLVWAMLKLVEIYQRWQI